MRSWDRDDHGDQHLELTSFRLDVLDTSYNDRARNRVQRTQATFESKIPVVYFEAASVRKVKLTALEVLRMRLTESLAEVEEAIRDLPVQEVMES